MVVARVWMLLGLLVAAWLTSDVVHAQAIRNSRFSIRGLLPKALTSFLTQSSPDVRQLSTASTASSEDNDAWTVASRYNESKAIYLAYVTSVSYCHEENIINWSCSPCALVQPLVDIRVVEDQKDNFQGLVGYNSESNAVIIAFRGSMDITNWIDNMTFLKKKPYSDFPDVAVHEGFYWAYQSVATQVVPAVQALLKKYPSAELWTTGHSLGAAVAALCAFELHLLHDLSVDALYTFGEPRVGNAEFSAQLTQAVPYLYRVTHFRDVVPHLPPKWLGFYHSTQEVFYDEFSQNYQICNKTEGEDPNCSDVCSPFGCRSVLDHLMYLNVTMSHLIC